MTSDVRRRGWTQPPKVWVGGQHRHDAAGVVGGAENVVRVLGQAADCTVIGLGAAAVKAGWRMLALWLLLGEGGAEARRLLGCLTPWPNIGKERMWDEA